MGQEDFLAKQYFNDGDFEKALVFYEKLSQKNPRRTDYAEGLVACYQQLERYQDAERFLLDKVSTNYVFPTFLIELGYNYRLQGQEEKAEEYYDKAIEKIEENPNFGYSIGYRFQKYALLDEAIQAYTKAVALKPELNYDFQLARIYGEQGSIEKMFSSYLSLVQDGRASRSNVLRNIDDFITEDETNENNILLRKVLLQNAQKNPDVLWNELLSWLFIQQKQYNSAFTQEKAIFKRTNEASVQRLQHLGNIGLEDGDIRTSKAVFTYIAEKSQNPVTRLDAELNLASIALRNPQPKTFGSLKKKFEELQEQYPINSETVSLQIAHANFLSFQLEQADTAIDLLKKCLQETTQSFRGGPGKTSSW